MHGAGTAGIIGVVGVALVALSRVLTMVLRARRPPTNWPGSSSAAAGLSYGQDAGRGDPAALHQVGHHPEYWTPKDQPVLDAEGVIGDDDT